MRIGAAQRKLSRNNGKRFLASGYDCVNRADWLRHYHDPVLPKGAQFLYKKDDGLWWLGKISASTTEDEVYLVRFLDDPGPIKLPVPPARYTTSTRAVRGSWCLQVHIASAFPQGVQRNVDESRGATVTSWLSSHRRPGLDSLPVALVAYQVILEPGIGQFREFESPRVHTRINWRGLFLCTN